MGRSHFSGAIEVGEHGYRSTGILATMVRLEAAAPAAGRFRFPDPTVLTAFAALGTDNKPKVTNISIGTTPGGSDIFSGNSGNNSLTSVLAVVTGDVYISQSGGSFPTKIVIQHVPVILD